ncbi:AAA family ATPase [Methanosphaera sp.]|uniref:ParA family protein n=1 Tax=Methanosphaera sp. TaxID=2666342 RepID=UPI0025D87C48|nr:AAA family ATPase [Methanosphaera sp.]
MGRIISILNQKGGVGKTTSTYNLATCLAKLNYKVLMIDLDPQGSLTLMTGNDPMAFDNTIMDIFERKNINDCINNLPINNLSFIPCNIKLSKFERTILRTSFLKSAISKIGFDYDYIFIDCPPSLGMLTLNALTASDYIIAPVETTPLSVFALDDLMDTVNELQDTDNPNLKFAGVIATKYASNTKLDNEMLNDLKRKYNVLGIIKNSVDAKKGIEDGLPCVEISPNSSIAKSYKEISENLINII